jgi:hypothetical protein
MLMKSGVRGFVAGYRGSVLLCWDGMGYVDAAAAGSERGLNLL